METVSPDDPRLAPYRDLRERDRLGRLGLFVAEGEVVLRELLLAEARGSHQVESLLLSEKQAERLAALPWFQPKAPVLVASRETMESVLGFHLHRGILALGRPSRERSLHELLEGPNATAPRQLACLFEISNHDNIGGIFRNLAAFGADAALLDQKSCDPYYRKALRVSVGGVLRVPFRRGGDELELTTALLDAGYQLLALSPRGEVPLHEVRPAPRHALLLGAEGPGLPAEVLARCTTVRLDMHGDFDSLNVATTSGIALHTLRRPTCIAGAGTA